MPLRVAVTAVTVPVKPDTAMFDGYGLPAALSLIVIAAVLENATAHVGPEVGVAVAVDVLVAVDVPLGDAVAVRVGLGLAVAVAVGEPQVVAVYVICNPADKLAVLNENCEKFVPVCSR